MTPEIQAKFLPAEDYARAEALDLVAMAAAAKLVAERYQADVG